MKSGRKENKRRYGFSALCPHGHMRRMDLDTISRVAMNGGVDGAAEAAKMSLNFIICDLEQFR
jgi:hypothetical protein